MKKGVNPLDKFDQILSIEPSAEWDGKLLQKINQTRAKRMELTGNRLLLLVVLLLVAMNIFSFSKSWLNDQSAQNRDNLKSIAAEYLITTNSSKY